LFPRHTGGHPKYTTYMETELRDALEEFAGIPDPPSQAVKDEIKAAIEAVQQEAARAIRDGEIGIMNDWWT